MMGVPAVAQPKPKLLTSPILVQVPIPKLRRQSEFGPKDA